MVRSRSGRRSNIVVLNMTGYDPDGSDFSGGGGGGFVIKPGLYPMKCKSCTRKVSKNDNDMFEWVFEGTGGAAKGKSFYLYTVISDEESAIQKLGKVFEAIEFEFDPTDGVKFDLDGAEDSEVVGEVYTDTYQNQDRSKLQMVFHPDKGEGEEEEERPSRRSSKKKRGNGKVTKMSEDEVKDLKEDELEELVEKHELDVDLSKSKTLRRKAAVVIEAMTEMDLIA